MIDLIDDSLAGDSINTYIYIYIYINSKTDIYNVPEVVATSSLWLHSHFY